MSPFDRLVSRYDLWYEAPFGRSAFELELRCLSELAGGFDRGLEVGVGTGRFASAMDIRFGVDSSLEMLRVAKERGILVVQGRGESLPFRDGGFDLVLLVATLCFVDEPLRVLRESRRVLKRAGRLILGLIVRESPWAEFYMKKASSGHPIYRHAKFYSFEEVMGMLSSSGFRPLEVRSTLMERPQDLEPVKNREVREGFHREAGFTCISAI